MAYGTLCFAREKASRTRRVANGPPSLAAWKGMGPRGYHKPRLLPRPVILIGYILTLFEAVSLIVLPVSGFPRGCQVGKCSEEWKRSQFEIHDKDLECKLLRTYRDCILNTQGCKGDISYHSMRSAVNKLMDTNDCTASGETVTPEDPKIPEPPIVHVPAVCQYKGRRVYRHCSLFGDPHIRTFYEESQTCKVKGAWPLVNNDYLTVQVTNDPVEGNTDATATSKLTVLVKGNPECTKADFQTYQAQSNLLPGTFEDGHVTYGPYKSIEIIEIDPGKHVEIHIRYIETVVAVRQIGRYFTFSIKMPEELVNKTSSYQEDINNDLDLCVQGCPLAEQINYKEYLAKQRYVKPMHTHTSGASFSSSSSWPNSNNRYSSSVKSYGNGSPLVSRDYAVKVCKEAKLVDFYFDSCVFDMMATGDENFTLSALSALRDDINFNPNVIRENRSDLTDIDQEFGSGSGASGHLWSSQSLCKSGFLCESKHVTLLLVVLTLLFTSVCSR